MLIGEAVIIAIWRMHFGATFTKVGLLAHTVWGRRAVEMAGLEETNGYGETGRALLAKMEDVLGLERCESDKMRLTQVVCMKCGFNCMCVCYPTDIPKECAKCGEMSMVFPPKVRLMDEEVE